MRQMGLWSPAVEVETARQSIEESVKRGKVCPAETNPEPAQADSAPPERLAQFLLAVVGRPIRLTITDNRRTMMTSRVTGSALHLRLHHMFLAAPREVWDALAIYLSEEDHDGRAGRVIDTYIEANMHRVRSRAGTIQPQGRFHDLQSIFDRLNREFFHDGCRSRVTWGRPGSRRYRRSIQLGCYVADDGLIRMHPCLDQSFVPELYVSWVMFHEMLHEAFGVEEKNGRRHVHPPAFVALEQTYPDYARAKAWEELHLPRLLRYRHTG
ncbi:MAG: hypothetical protein AAF658_04775 [Myxococcota bacterium]